ncbi:putative ESX-1 scaffolding and assembly protein SaeB [Mycolicibacterium litorale]|uniref:Putative ESX-1 scaffolding and assembly protein SaeB n=1 Tax=Mycolicibacterium litorale TaxID=758802 RepID=A0A6S6P0F3_9MYCO|nr:hypothetical protein [Mycolicibacterium litorale]BCI50767.1 putative ESX-1 scaffolding and assembly protein SaeB [Mycolicibacterium litorale]
MTARYGQLTHTSFDTREHTGGWQVKETSADLSPDEVHALTSGVRTVFRPAQPLPAYPTPEQLEHGPRRLAYGRLDGHRAGYWHTVPAGSDSTGRPGNVFAHALLDRAAGERSHRPIEWWRSSGWLCPYGAHAVAAAALPGDPPAPGATVTKDSVVDFALDPDAWRLATLFGLLDAVAAALDGGPPVVLGVESADSAAQWIGLVSFLMSAGTAARLNFSTFDRADQLTLARQSRQHLTAVPVEDLEDLPDDVVAISEHATLSLGELDREPHRTAGGQTIAVTPWSAMAQVVLLDRESARTVLDDIDHYAAQVADTGLHPAWPLAMAVAHRQAYADALTEAHTVIAAHSPRAANDSVVARTMAEVMRTALGTSTADAWKAVRDTPDGPAAELATVSYLCRAVADRDWLSRPGPVPARERLERRPPPRELHDAITPALVAARADGPRQVARLADLLLRSGIEDGRVLDALRDDVADRLTDQRAGADLIGELRETVGDATRLALAAALLRDSGDPPAVDGDVLDWLADGLPAPAPQDLWRAEAWDPVWTRAALRGVRTLQRGGGEPADRWASLWWLRISGSPRFEEVAGSSVWHPEELLTAVGESTLPGAAAVRTLVGAPPSSALDRLAQTVLRTNNDDVAVACAAVRIFDPRTWIEQGYAASHQSAYAALWERAVEAAGIAEVHHDFAVRLVTFAAIAATAGQPYPKAGALLGAETQVAADAFGHLAALLDTYVLNAMSVLAVAALRFGHNGDDLPAATDAIEDLIWRAARHVLVTRRPDTIDVGMVAATMAQLSGEPTDGAVRRHRKTVLRLLARRPEAQPAPTARTRWSR